MAAKRSRLVLLFGARGQVGHELRQVLSDSANVVALNSAAADFRKLDTLRTIMREHRPDIVVNAVGYTAVDMAESETEMAHAVNAAGPAVLADEAEAIGACLVHYCTDYVYDGRKISPYVETDTPNPLSVYGRTKLAGAQDVRACRRHLIFRTSWVVGVHGKNFVKTILHLASARADLQVVNDQFGAPTSAALLAQVTKTVLWQMAEQPPEDPHWGLYHLVAGGETSWHGFARHIIARAGAMGIPLKATPERVAAIAASDYPAPAKRPANSRLDTSKLRATFALALPDWTEGVNDVLTRLSRVITT
jgi:dTDP-4-dehydrorhamnose reductase